MMSGVPPITTPTIPAGRLAATAQPVLSAPGGLTLRPWTGPDMPAVAAAYADPDIQQWHGFRLLDEDEARALIKRWQDDWPAERAAHWAVTRDGEVVGRTGLREMNLRHGWAECAYWTMPSARGSGIAPRALRAMADWALGEAGFHRLWLKHSTANPASCRVGLKAGFAAEGTTRGSELHTDGWHDLHVHARIAGRRAALPGCFIDSPAGATQDGPRVLGDGSHGKRGR